MKPKAYSVKFLFGYVLLITPVILFFLLIWNARWIGDDGFINIRVVNNILSGFGPVYNTGERVEAFTSPLWILFLLFFGAVGFSPDSASVYLGITCSVFGMCFSIFGSKIMDDQLNDSSVQTHFPLGMLVYAMLPPAWDYGSSGLENGLGLFWLGFSYFLLASILSKYSNEKFKHNKWITLYAVLLGFGPLIRPELSIFSIGLIVPVIVLLLECKKKEQHIWKIGLKTLWLGLIMIVPFVFYQLFRMGYFAALTSNTAIAKEAFLANWEQGWHYFDNFFKLYLLYMPLIILIALSLVKILHFKLWSKRTALVSLILCGVMYTLAVVKVGGDFMHGRFFLPGLFGGLMPLATIAVYRTGQSLFLKIVSATTVLSVLLWCIYCGTSLRMPVENQNGIGDERGWYTRRSITPNPTSIKDYKEHFTYKDGKSLEERKNKSCQKNSEVSKYSCTSYVLIDNERFGKVNKNNNEIPLDLSKVPESTKLVVMRAGIGIFGAVSGHSIHVVDRFGLVDPIGSRILLRRRGRPGHEKRFSNNWMVARFADLDSVDDKQVIEAAHALTCSPLSDLIEAVTAPLTFARFWKNVSMSFEFQKIRVPVSPSEAKDKFCIN